MDRKQAEEIVRETWKRFGQQDPKLFAATVKMVQQLHGALVVAFNNQLRGILDQVDAEEAAEGLRIEEGA